MALGLLGKKLGMTQLFNEHGRVVTVTVLQAGPCTVTQVKEPKTDGYRAAQIGFEPVKAGRVNKPRKGHAKKSGGTAFRHLREFRLGDTDEVAVGQQVMVDVFKEGELVDVRGTSIGKGFQGGMKRWNWRGGGATHGSMSHRAPGSIGSTTTPGRVIRGHHLPGHMGHANVTVQNLRVMKVDADANVLVVEGAVPGPDEGVLLIKKSAKWPGKIVAAKGIQEVLVEEEEESGAKKPAAKKK